MAAGEVNVRTGKPALAAGYSRSTINHTLAVVSQFYAPPAGKTAMRPIKRWRRALNTKLPDRTTGRAGVVRAFR